MIYGENGTPIDPLMKQRALLVRPLDKYGPICVGDEVVINRMYFDHDLVLIIEVVKRLFPETGPTSVTFSDCEEPCNEWGELCRLPEGHHGEHDPRDPKSVEWRAPKPEEFCGAEVGIRPSWMGVDQHDPCRCIRPKGHQGEHQCSHTIEEKSK